MSGGTCFARSSRPRPAAPASGCTSRAKTSRLTAAPSAWRTSIAAWPSQSSSRFVRDVLEGFMSSVLFIDDELALSAIMGTLLRAHGHDVRCAASAEAAFAAMHERVPHLVLLDLHMGDTDGMELLRRFRSTAPNVPVVMVTGYGDVQTAVAAMKLGAVDFVTKPFNNEEFLRRLDRLLIVP